MEKELKNLIIKFQVSNMRTENLMNNIEEVRTLLNQYEYCLTKELETSNELAKKIAIVNILVRLKQTSKKETRRNMINFEMYNVNCPYCNENLRIIHDDGYGYEEDTLHQQECRHCLKVFVYTTSIIYLYNASKADCLNEGEHKYVPTKTIPIEATRLRCSECGDEKPLDRN